MKIINDEKFNLRKGEIKIFFIEITLEKDDDIRGIVSGIEDAGCINCAGVDFTGAAFEKMVKVKANQTKKLWFYVKAPCISGEYKCDVLVKNAENKLVYSSVILLSVCDEEVGDEQFLELDSLRKLYWLNSTCAIDHEIIKPFTAVEYRKNTIKILGREIELDDLGFPKNITTHFSQSVRLSNESYKVLSDKIKLVVGNEQFKNNKFSFDNKLDSVKIITENESENFLLKVIATIEQDGYCDYKVTLKAKREITIGGVEFIIPVTEYSRKYFMGLGKKGGFFTSSLDWKWAKEKHQDTFWVGNVNAGIRVKLKGENYRKPLVNIYYSYRPLNMPKSWCNEGLGGVRYQDGSFIAYSGEHQLKKEEELRFDFDLMVTPFKPIDVKKHFNMRMYHRPPAYKYDLNEIKTANVINVHHGNDLNPYINYPFFEDEALSNFINKAHNKGVRVNVYYTLRELTVFLPELKALIDLDGEIFVKPEKEIETPFLWQAENHKWVRENVGENLIPAWRQVLNGEKYKGEYDSAIITDGQSRLCNFYVEGVKQLMDRIDIDGIYVDDVAYDRTTMKRIRKVLNRKENSIIDTHTWNHFVSNAGYVSSLNLYTELVPYFDKMWIGEGFDSYDFPIDYWLVEISGIPFGVMSELMLKGNPHRGLLFGMTNRLLWRENSDPTNIWEVFDEYALDDCEIIGPWDDRNNVKLSNPHCYATIYKKDNEKFMALGNWTNEEQTTKIELLGEQDYSFHIPEIRDFQKTTDIENEVSIPGGLGFFIKVIN